MSDATDPPILLDRAAALIAGGGYREARQLLVGLRQGPLDPATAARARTLLATATYKDLELPLRRALDRALEILEEAGPLDAGSGREALAVGGAIHKRGWELTGQSVDLLRAVELYELGHDSADPDVDGECGTGAALLLDVLADLDAREAPRSPTLRAQCRALSDRADAIRRELLERLTGPDAAPASGDARWWRVSALAQAHFGLGDHAAAKRVVDDAVAAGAPAWLGRTVAQQLSALARLASEARDAAGGAEVAQQDVVGAAIGTLDPAAIDAAYAGRLGLALSGGGFRASFFHVGVLARLAELDVLRHVQVLSCVSGGSIVGAHYYLKLKRLLEEHPDEALSRDSYVQLVRELEGELLAGVAKNIRMRVLTSPVATLRAAFSTGYTRTLRAGELYAQLLYARTGPRVPRHMDELLVRPAGWPADAPPFSPRRDNWQRSHKVPILVLNATSLNTGRNWQFTARRMGEPAPSDLRDVDGGTWLAPVDYEPARADRRMPLGHAVAASACVPGIFEPLVLTGLYDGYTVRLVDGGVHDNQGVASVTEQECSAIVVSDASGQMVTQTTPKSSLLAVPRRSSSIQGARVRQSQFRELAVRRATSALRALDVVHLRRGLLAAPTTAKGTPDPRPGFDADGLPTAQPAGGAPPPATDRPPLPAPIQEALARLRTDLDAFNQMEAFSLMWSGYLMIGDELRETPVEGLTPTTDLDATDPGTRWRFAAIRAWLDGGEREARLERVLRAGAERFFKPARLGAPFTRWSALGRVER